MRFLKYRTKWYLFTVTIFISIAIGLSPHLVRAAGTGSNLVALLEDADLTLVGEDIGDWAGYFASPAGDVNGDGFQDALVGSPMAGNKICPYPPNPDGSCPGLPKGEGIAYLILGRPDGFWPQSPMDLGEADASFLGCEVDSMTARQLYTAGDVNGDGKDDILVSGWKCGVNFTGKAYLFLGRSDVSTWGSQYPVEAADASFLGEHEEDFLSYYVSTAGDVNADGYDDFLITSTHNDQTAEEAGKVYLILGRAAADWGTDFDIALADASFLGEAVGDRLGRSATGVGDVNGDGYEDFLIASIESDYSGVDAGQSYLFLGRAAPTDANYDPDRPWWGTDFSVANADASFVGEAEGDESGRRVAMAGDVNGDGYSDMLIGSALNDQSGPDAGIAHLILGRPAADWGMRYSLMNADASFTGEERRDQAGRRLSGAGDVNGDGYDDLLIGAPHNEQGSEIESVSAGAAYVIFGRENADWGNYYSLRAADIIHVGKPDVGVAGYDLAGLGDFNGDGIDDYLIAAFGGRNNGEVPGEIYILRGNQNPVPINFLPDRNMGESMTWSRFTGDYWDPNGWSDVARSYLSLGETVGDEIGIFVRYDRTSNQLFLRDRLDQDWMGPCTPGETMLLNNGVVQLDCRGSSVTSKGDYVLRVLWRARWVLSDIGSPRFKVFLRAVDESDHDSGYREFGTWSLGNEKIYFPIIQN